MIWIATICLLAIAAWLIFNGINERRWVQAHSHDETVAADEGFLPNFSTAVAKRRVDADGKLSIRDENTRFAKAVAKVQEKTARIGEKVEARAQAARIDDDQRPASAADESDFFGRSVAKVKGATAKLDGKLDERMRRERMKGEEAPAGRSITEEGGLFSTAVAKVSQRTEAIGQRVAEKARSRAGDERTNLDQEDSLFAKAVRKVSGGLEKVEGKLDQRAQRSHDDGDDFMTRMSKTVGAKVNEIDEKIVDTGRDVQRRIDK